MKKVLLTAAKMDTARFIPLGIGYIAAVCEEAGHTVEIYDELPESADSLAEMVQTFQPDVVGISCMTSTFTKASEYGREVRKANPNVPIVFGGVHPTVAIEDTLSYDFVDYVVFGEGEITFSEFLDNLDSPEGPKSGNIKGLAYIKDGEAVINEPRPLIPDLDTLPRPARRLFSMDYYAQRWNWPRGYWFKTANIMSSRGCPYACTYCGSKSMWGRSFRAFSAERTVDEVEHLVRTYGFECFSFSDDTFGVDKKRAIRVAQIIKERGLKIKLRFQLRANTCDEEMVRELKSAGCIHVDIGVESGSDRILKQMKKGVNVDQIKNAVATVKRHNINIGATFIIGSPGETMEDVEATRTLARHLDAHYTQFFIMTPYPGTELFEFAKNGNLLPPSLNWEDFRHGGADLKPFLNTNFSPEELIRLRDELNNGFSNKIAKNYLKSPNFIKDMIGMAARDPKLILQFIKNYRATRNMGSALKLLLPHKL